MFCSLCVGLHLDQADTDEGAAHHAGFANLVQYNQQKAAASCACLERDENDSELDAKTNARFVTAITLLDRH
jgi:hypothetical protein